MGKIKSLQVMRGIAALIVVMFHYNYFLKEGSAFIDIYNSLFSWGVIGVDIFFVISGFIMIYTTTNLKHGFASSRKFLMNRLLRILPVYYFGLIIAFLVGGAMSIFHYHDKLVNIISALTFTVYRNDITPHYIDDGSLYNIRWTLNYEMYFYLVFSICLFFRFRLLALAAWGLVAVVIAPVLSGFTPSLSTHGYAFEKPLYGLLTNPLILEFLIGVVCAYAFIALKKYHHSIKVNLLFAVAALLTAIYLIDGLINGYVHAVYIPSTIVVGFFLFSLCMAEPLIKKYIPNFLVRLGDISFSLYLLHTLVGILLFKRIGGLYTSDSYKILVVGIAVLISIVAAYFSHKYIEVKFVNYLKQKMSSKKALAKAINDAP
ncbi:TPA: acyltransferase family protein [Escherichia coli]